jgi:hypothetical protein
MKTIARFFALVTLLAAAALAQTGPGGSDYVAGVRYVLVAPAGACSSTSIIQLVMGPGDLWACVSGTWTKIASGGGGGLSYPLLLPDGDVSHPQLSSASFPTDGFYIAAGRPNWIFERSGTQVFAFRNTVAGSARAIAIGASASICFADSNTLDANDSSNCGGYLSRGGSTNTLKFGSASNTADGTFSTGTITNTLFSIPASTDPINVPVIFPAMLPSSGFNYDAPSDVFFWTDSAGSGTVLYGLQGTQNTNGSSGLFAVEGPGDPWVGFATYGPPLPPVCSHCLRPANGGLGSEAGAVGQFAPFTATQYWTSSNCAAVGTAANPSVASCGAASEGVVYCDVAASAGTCEIDTTAAGANSDIFITATGSANTRLGKTCNTAPSVVPAIPVKTITPGANFILNMDTVAVNGMCFFFHIGNQ